MRGLGLTVASLLISTQMLVGMGLPKGVTSTTFQDPPNEFRLVQYGLSHKSLKDYPDWGIGGHLAFFYNYLYRQGNKGATRIGPLVDAAAKSGRTVWLADDWGYPSGMAGGRVVAESPDFEVRSLVMLVQKGSGPKAINWSLPKDLHDIVYAGIYPSGKNGIDVGKGRVIRAKSKSLSNKGLKGPWELRVFARYTRSKNVQAQSTMKQFGIPGGTRIS